MEAGPLSQWLFSTLAEAGLPVICVETRHMRAALKSQVNKTDRNDARGIAQMTRAGLYRPVHVKTLRSQKLRMLLTQPQAAAVESQLVDNLPELAVVRSAKWSWLKAWAMKIARQPRAEKGDRGLGAPIGRDHAPHRG